MDGNPLEQIKQRRAPGRRGRTTTGAPAPPATTDQPVTQQVQRSMPFLFDPAEMPVVVEAGGYLPRADFDEFYVVAAVDGNRTVVPDGCRTAVSTRMWLAGQHVRRDVYAAYLKELGGEIYERWVASVAPVQTVPLPNPDTATGK
jgi:hypothetical protein